MNLATVLRLTAILEVAAAFAGWAGGFAFALCRHLRAILKPAAWAALAGVPLITLLMALGGVPVGAALVFSAASAVVWAPVFGFLTWGVSELHASGFGTGKGRVRYTGPPGASSTRTEHASAARAKRRSAQRTRRRNKRR